MVSKDEIILELVKDCKQHLIDLDNKVDHIQLEQVRQSELHKLNAENLEEHMKRTALSEQRLVLVENHVLKVNTISKFIIKTGVALTGLVAFLTGVFTLISYFYH